MCGACEVVWFGPSTYESLPAAEPAAQASRFGSVSALAHLGGAVIGVAGWLAWRHVDRRRPA